MTNPEACPIVSGCGGGGTRRRPKRFEDSWAGGAAHPQKRFLPALGPLRQAVLPELIHIDLELRLKAGIPVRVGGLPARFPRVGGDGR